MKNTNRNLRNLTAILIALFLYGMLPVGTALADTAPSTTSQMSILDFASSLQKTDSSELVGIFTQDVMALPILQQPTPVSAFVSTQEDTVTQFGLASKYGSTGLLAHNTLAGKYFSSLSIGTIITLVYGDGSLRYYQVSEIKKFQALSPNSTSSNFVDLGNPGLSLSSTQLFYKTFGLKDALVLQTCILEDGNPSWGRLFVIATPIEKPVHNFTYFDLANSLN